MAVEAKISPKAKTQRKEVNMQSRYFKQLLPLSAVAFLILAFLTIELTPEPCERTEAQKEERVVPTSI